MDVRIKYPKFRTYKAGSYNEGFLLGVIMGFLTSTKRGSPRRGRWVLMEEDVPKIENEIVFAAADMIP